MKRNASPIQAARFIISPILLHGVVLAFSIPSPSHAVATTEHQESLVSLVENGVEVSLPQPTYYAILERRATRLRTLSATGDTLINPEDPTVAFKIQSIGEKGLVGQEGRKGREQLLKPGTSIPGFPGLVFGGSVKLSRLQYRSRPVDRVLHAEPVLLSLSGSRAILEVEILRSGSSPAAQGSRSSPASAASQTTREKLSPGVFAKIEIKEVNGDEYVLGAESLRPAVDNIDQVLADLKPMITPVFSTKTGRSLHLASNVTDGILSRSGFTVTNPKIARRFGIEVGDTILQINKHPIDGPLSAWWTYQEVIIRNPLLEELQVEIRRGDSLVTKTYKIR